MITAAQTADVRNQMKNIRTTMPHSHFFGCMEIQTPGPETGASLRRIRVRARVQDAPVSCAHRHVKHYHGRISKGVVVDCSSGGVLFAGACLSSVTASEHNVFHVCPHGKRLEERLFLDIFSLIAIVYIIKV